jgi:DNA-binding transcriptional MerR regulator
METTYTIGVLAKEVGITVKAIRVYEKRGLLIPLGYTESRYRLYGEDAKLTLQKILTMKYLGFSLDEIKDRMEKEKGMDIRKSLSYQKKLLEAKRMQLNRLIYCVERAEERCVGDAIDWESVTDILKAIVMDRGADERHWFLLQHSTSSEDWYEQIYRKIAFKEGETVLDIGCGYGKLWRNNWRKLPENLKVIVVTICMEEVMYPR